MPSKPDVHTSLFRNPFVSRARRNARHTRQVVLKRYSVRVARRGSSEAYLITQE
jgi:hypothetical protein